MDDISTPSLSEFKTKCSCSNFNEEQDEAFIIQAYHRLIDYIKKHQELIVGSYSAFCNYQGVDYGSEYECQLKLLAVTKGTPSIPLDIRWHYYSGYIWSGEDIHDFYLPDNPTSITSHGIDFLYNAGVWFSCNPTPQTDTRRPRGRRNFADKYQEDGMPPEQRGYYKHQQIFETLGCQLCYKELDRHDDFFICTGFGCGALLCSVCFNSLPLTEKNYDPANAGWDCWCHVCYSFITKQYRAIGDILAVCNNCSIDDIRKLFIRLPNGIRPIPYSRLDSAHELPIIVADNIICTESDYFYKYSDPTQISVPEPLKNRVLTMTTDDLNSIVQPPRGYSDLAKWLFIDYRPKLDSTDTWAICCEPDGSHEVASVNINHWGNITMHIVFPDVESFLKAEQASGPTLDGSCDAGGEAVTKK